VHVIRHHHTRAQFVQRALGFANQQLRRDYLS
jgi:hypothetical protein